MQAACNSARQNPGEENAFRQLRLNQWVKQAVRWMPMEKWDKCAFPVNLEELEGRVCYGGLDLSSTTDITAFVLVFPPTDEDDKYYVLPYFWIPEENMDLRVKRDHVPYDIWERQGFLNGSVSVSISEKSPSIGGALCRWCRTLRVWDLPLFLSDRALQVCRRQQRS